MITANAIRAGIQEALIERMADVRPQLKQINGGAAEGDVFSSFHVRLDDGSNVVVQVIKMY